jgi:hypothetical protein
MDSILDLSLCLSSMMGRAVKAESMAELQRPAQGLPCCYGERRGMKSARVSLNTLAMSSYHTAVVWVYSCC